jgi:hypothetical protein
MMLCINIAVTLTALVLALALGGNKIAYWAAALLSWLVIWAPFAGWLFERFAAGSTRIINTSDERVSPTA